MDAFIRKMSIPKWKKWRTVEEFDYFSEGVGISFRGDDRSRSICGVLTTIGILAFGAYLFQYYLLNALETTSPKIQFDVITEKEALTYNTTNSDLNFFFLLPDPLIEIKFASGNYSTLPEEYTPTDADLYGSYSPPSDPTSTGTDFDPLTDPGTATPDPDTGFRRRILQYENLEKVSRSNLKNRLLQGAEISSSYLKFDDYQKYFEIAILYIQSKNKIVSGKKVTTWTQFKIDLVPCKNVTWMLAEENKKFLDLNSYARDVIKDNAFCLAVNKSHNVFGNWLTESESFINIEITLCHPAKSSKCSTDVNTIFAPDKDQNLLIGSFSSTVNNSNYDEPFVREFKSHGDLALNTIMTNQVGVNYKRIQVVTDKGKLFEDEDTQYIGIIDEVDIATKPALTYNFGGSGFEINEEIVVANIQIKGSSRIDQYKRSYDKFFDFMGNWGGGMEFVFICATILAIYTEDFLKDRRLKRITAEQLGLNPIKQEETKKMGCCAKRKIEHDMDEYIEEVTEQTLTFEKMVADGVLVQVVREALVPNEVRLLAPLLYALQKEQDEKAEKAEKSEKVPDTAGRKLAYSDQSGEKPKDEPMTVETAMRRFKSPEFEQQYPAFASFKKKYHHLLPGSSLYSPKTQHEAHETNLPIISPDGTNGNFMSPRSDRIPEENNEGINNIVGLPLRGTKIISGTQNMQ